MYRRLKRSLGLLETTACGVGVILGAGVYALIGQAAGLAGNSLWMSFLIGAIIASFTGLSYAELSSMFPKASAEYFYAKAGFRNKGLSFIIGWITIFTELVAAATVALGFAGYFSSLLPFNIPLIVIAVSLIGILSLLNFYGIEESSRINILFTIIEAVGLIFIIFLGLKYFGSVNYFEAPAGFSGVFMGAALIFFAYLGFEEIVNVSEETKKAKRIIPKAIVISIIITTVIYILVSLSVVSILPWQTLGASNAPLADVASAALPGSTTALIFVALFATINTILIMLIVTSRMLYGMAKDGALFKSLSRIHPKRRTPWVSVFLTMVLAMAFVLIGNIKTVASIANFGAFLIFISVNLSLIWIRYKKPNLKRKFKVPLNIGKFPVLPALGILVCVLMLAHLEPITILVGISIILLGFVTFKILEKIKKNA